MGRKRKGPEVMIAVSQRMDAAQWAEFTAAAGQPAEVTREFIAWYLRKPGASLPVRPARPAVADDPLAERAAS
jgi:hypothetical protein